MKKSAPGLIFFLVFSASLSPWLSAQTQVVPIRDILQNPQAFAGKAVLLEGTIVRVVEGSGSFFFVELQDSELDTIRVRTELKSLDVGQIFRVHGRVRVDVFSLAPFVMEEVMLYRGVNTGYSLPPATTSTPPPVSKRQAPAKPAEPAKEKADLSWLIQPRKKAETPPPSRTEAPPRPATQSTPPPPAKPSSGQATPVTPSRATPSESGMFAFCFRQAQGPLQDIMITQLGRLFTMIVHPTCRFTNNRLTFSGRDGGGTLKASFVTTYSGLLLGEGQAVWELIFNSEGNIADIRFIRDTSPFTDVGLLNQVKGRIISYIVDQIEALQF